MYIAPTLRSTNLLHELPDGGQWIRTRWNCRCEQVLENHDRGLPNSGGNKWLLRKKTRGSFSHGFIIDSNRNWTSQYQDIVIVFNTKCRDNSLTPGGTATGHTIKVNSNPVTTLYQSGSGGAVWVLRIPVLCNADDIITYSYNETVGNTTAVDDGQEIFSITDIPLNNFLTKRIRFTLRNSSGNLVTNEKVKLSVHLYSSGVANEEPGDYVRGDNPLGGDWMRRIMNATPTTDSNGLIDIRYSGVHNLPVGTDIYVVVYRPDNSPTESFAWVTKIQ